MASFREASSFTFSDFPEDVQLRILSFLTPSDISAFACVSKRFVSLCRNENGRVWYAMCDNRWGSKTQIRKWGDGKIGFKLLYKTLSEYENLIGFWRRSAGVSGGGGISGDAPLVFFEWAESCVTGSRISPSKDGSYNVIKSPFMWLSLSGDGQLLNYLKNYTHNNDMEPSSRSDSGMDLVQVSVSFMGKGHVVLEESNWNWGNSSGGSPNGNGNKNSNNVIVGSPEAAIGSPPDRMMSEMYQYFANRRSPGAGGERAWRRQRKREKERQGRRKWEPEHLVKIVNCTPSPSRPLQGLWKGICNDMSLDFYLVAYDDIGGVTCRRVGDCLKPVFGYSPVFWTSNATFIDSPLSHEEDYVYYTRMHLRPTTEVEAINEYSPSRIMCIKSSYNMVIPNLTATSATQRHMEGRIWLYVDGTFGFGLLCNNFIVDLKHIAQDDRLMDATELSIG